MLTSVICLYRFEHTSTSCLYNFVSFFGDCVSGFLVCVQRKDICTSIDYVAIRWQSVSEVIKICHTPDLQFSHMQTHIRMERENVLWNNTTRCLQCGQADVQFRLWYDFKKLKAIGLVTAYDESVRKRVSVFLNVRILRVCQRLN